jgi:hypothetical protein
VVHAYIKEIDVLYRECTVLVFRQKWTLEDAIGSHACSLEASERVTNGTHLGCSLLLPGGTVNSVQTLKAGELISTIQLKDVVAVTEIGSKTFRLKTAEPFGASQTHEMVIEADNTKVMQKWLAGMKNDTTLVNSVGFSSNRAELIMECYLLKVQPFGVMDTTRWFRLTTKKFSYFKTEAGEELGSVPFEYVSAVTVIGKKDFTLTSVQPFTKTGMFEVYCRCKTPALRQKWITGLNKVLPAHKLFHKK